MVCLLGLVVFLAGSHRTSGRIPRIFGSRIEIADIQPLQLVNVEKIQALSDDSSYQYVVDANPKSIDNNDIVTVSYFSTTASSDDWIGAYSFSAGSSWNETAPVMYAYCDVDSNYVSSGFGSLSFNLTNLRADVSFYYFTNGLSNPRIANMTSSTVTFKNPNEQLRPRITATGDDDTLKLLWSSSSSVTPVLRWGLSEGQYSDQSFATTSTILQESLCGAPANGVGWRDLGLIHTALFEGLSALPASTKVYYTFGDETSDTFAPERVMTVPPSRGKQSLDRPTTLIIYGDLGRGSTDDAFTWDETYHPAVYTAMSVGGLVASHQVDAVLHIGDLSYANGYESAWDFFLNMISPIAGGVLYLTVVGNHESDWVDSASYFQGEDSGGECGVPAAMLLPSPEPASTDEPWWSYDVGLVHIIGFSSEHDFTRGSKQLRWLEDDLVSVNRSVTPWIIFGSHRPMYVNSVWASSAKSDGSVMDLMIEHVEPLLWAHRVNLGVYGHFHAFQRHAAVKGKRTVQHSEQIVVEEGDQSSVYLYNNPQATVHLIVGTAGAPFHHNCDTDKPDWNEDCFYRWGYLLVSAVNSTYLEVKWVNSVNETVDMHAIITQDADPSGCWSTDDLALESMSVITVVLLKLLAVVGVLVVVVAMSRRYFFPRSIVPNHGPSGESQPLLSKDVHFMSDHP